MSSTLQATFPRHAKKPVREEKTWQERKGEVDAVLRAPEESATKILLAAHASRMICSVSTGKESVALLSVMLENGIECWPVHRYWVPGLEFEEEVLCALENKLGVKIRRIQERIVRNMESNDVLMIRNVWNIRTTPVTKDWWDKELRRQSGLRWMAMGIKACDGPIRRLALTKHPNPNAKLGKVYPLAWWSTKQVWEYIHKRELPVSKAYKWFGRSMDCLNIKHVYPLKAGAPNDYRKIIDKFPLLEPLIWLYEKRGREFGFRELPEC